MATALSCVGFNYYKFDDNDGISYSFQDSSNFREALTIITTLRNKNKKR